MAKHIIDYFRKKDKSEELNEDWHPVTKSVCLHTPIYHNKDLMPPVLNDGEYETIEHERERFKNLPPLTVLYEVAKRLDGKLARLIPGDDKSTPIVLKETKMGMCTIVFYKNNLRFTIFETSTFKKPCSTKKIITNRNSIYGLQKAFESIDQGVYDSVFLNQNK